MCRSCWNVFSLLTPSVVEYDAARRLPVVLACRGLKGQVSPEMTVLSSLPDFLLLKTFLELNSQTALQRNCWLLREVQDNMLINVSTYSHLHFKLGALVSASLQCRQLSVTWNWARRSIPKPDTVVSLEAAVRGLQTVINMRTLLRCLEHLDQCQPEEPTGHYTPLKVAQRVNTAGRHGGWETESWRLL